MGIVAGMTQIPLTLIKTCDMCPEQYDVLIGKTTVGYLRVRHGHFTVQVPDAGGETIYMADVAGDGAFEDEERAWFLERAKSAIQIHYQVQMMTEGYEDATGP